MSVICDKDDKRHDYFLELLDPDKETIDRITKDHQKLTKDPNINRKE